MITSIHWSPDDEFLMLYCGKTQEVHLRCFNSTIIEARSDQEAGWVGHIADQTAGIEGVYWSSDSR
jgi:hypothetical protein